MRSLFYCGWYTSLPGGQSYKQRSLFKCAIVYFF